MKSAVFYGKHDLRIEDRKIPEVGKNDVLIRIKACGVCGTDVHIFEGDKGAAECNPPIILGHELSGTVENTGLDVTTIKPGDRVCVDPNNCCDSCDYCREGIAHFCHNKIGYGTTVNGGFAEFCCVNEKQVYLLGNNTDFIAGAMTEPVACCIHGVDMCNIVLGSKVVVFGAGMIGLIMMQLARNSGADQVVMIEPVEKKRVMAQKLGADFCIDPLTQDPKEVLVSNGISRVTTVIECVGNVSTIKQAIDLAGTKSTVMMFGLTKPDDELSIKPFEIFQKEIELKSSYINPYTQQRALDLINSGAIDVKSMINEVCGLENLSNILSKPELRATGKFVIDPSL